MGKNHIFNKIGILTLSVTILTAGILPSLSHAEEVQQVEQTNEELVTGGTKVYIDETTYVIDESNLINRSQTESVYPNKQGPSRVPVGDGGASWTYKKTIYGDTSNRDGFVGAVATVILNSIPGGGIISKAKTIWNSILVYLGFGNYTPKYLKAEIYTKNDSYYNRTKVVYYKYSDSGRTKLIESSTRYHEVQIKDYR